MCSILTVSCRPSEKHPRSAAIEIAEYDYDIEPVDREKVKICHQDVSDLIKRHQLSGILIFCFLF